MTLDQDLATRWTPSKEQDGAAAVALTIVPNPDDGVYTVHALVNKQHGWWTEDVEVEYMTRVFTDRESALAACQGLAEWTHAEKGVPVSGGYTWHLPAKGEPQTTADGTVWETRWAVWEDICSEFPVPEWRQEARAARAAREEPEIDDPDA